MTNDKGILINNIYHMLTYAFQVLKQTNYEDVAGESFENIEDLFAAILSKGLAQQLKQGLYKEYIVKEDNLPLMRGKLNIQGTIKNRIQRKQILACEFDELSVNNIYNQILKTTAIYLIICKSVSKENKSNLRKSLLFFDEIETLEPSEIRWNALRYQRNNRSYEMLLNICYFVLDGMLQTTEKGKYQMAAFSDEHMARLYERFILEYYKHHHPQLNPRAAYVEWDLDEGNDENAIKFLPSMKTDITLTKGEKTLILDAKYYSHTMQQQFDKYSVHSANLYQIFAYVKNLDKNNSGNVSGLLMYAKTQEAITPDYVYRMGGNIIGAKSLDLSADFAVISSTLDALVKEYL